MKELILKENEGTPVFVGLKECSTKHSACTA
jgi:hypothetical protein